MKDWIQVGVCCLGLVASAAAAENAVLKNGFAIRHERRQVNGLNTRLFLSTGDGSFVDVASADIDKFEKVEEVVAPTPEMTASPKPDLKALVKDASAKTLIDEDFIHSVIRAESAARVRAVSAKGARGLMQLMPATAKELGVQDAFNEAQNIDGGTRHLKALLDRYHGDAVKALAAYNAGASRVDRYKGVPPYRETRMYVAKIIRDYNRAKLTKKSGD
ncbi:MAG TPA: lytic transglycosylase domain-containing protein [Terriglobales bacterium]|nr:lytic transglycosylase domain-containing protein [Terriglobales bacterium]